MVGANRAGKTCLHTYLEEQSMSLATHFGFVQAKILPACSCTESTIIVSRFEYIGDAGLSLSPFAVESGAHSGEEYFNSVEIPRDPFASGMFDEFLSIELVILRTYAASVKVRRSAKGLFGGKKLRESRTFKILQFIYTRQEPKLVVSTTCSRSSLGTVTLSKRCWTSQRLTTSE